MGRSQTPFLEFHAIGEKREYRRLQTYVVYQDRVGYIWLGGHGSIRRYDGHEVRDYPLRGARSRPIWIRGLAEDGAGRLFAGGRGGLRQYDRNRDRWTPVEVPAGADDRILRADLVSLRSDGIGGLWLLSGKRLARFSPTTGVTRYPQLDSLPDLSRVTCVDDRHRLLVAQSNGVVLRFDAAARTLERFDVGRSVDPPLKSAAIRSMCLDPDGHRLWVGTNRGLVRFEPSSRRGTRFVSEHPVIEYRMRTTALSLLWDRWGQFWIGTSTTGLHRVEVEGNRVYRYRHAPDRQLSLPGDHVGALYQDRSGAIWAATARGVCRFDARPRRFRFYPTSRRLDADGAVRDIARDRDGRVWVASQKNGIKVFDRTRNVMLSYVESSGGLSNNKTTSLSSSPDGMWIGTWGGGLNLFDSKAGRFRVMRHDPNKPSSLPSDFVSSLIRDDAGLLWVSTKEGLCYLDGTGTGFKAVELPRLDVQPPRFRLVRDANSDLLLISGWPEYVVVDPVSKVARVGRLPAANDRAHSLIEVLVRPRGARWFSTSDGVFRGSIRTEAERVAWTDGPLRARIACFAMGADGGIWASSARGIYRFDAHGTPVARYSARDHLFGVGAAFALSANPRDPRLYFGGHAGLHEFDPSRIEVPRPPVADFVFRLRVRGEDRPLGRARDVIELEHDENDIEFDYVGFDYLDPAGVRYQHRLQGVDVSWVDAGRGRSVRYSNLAGGDYVFEVRARPSLGEWSSASAPIALRIAIPFWKTWWMLGLVTIALIGMTVGFVQWRLHRVSRINQMLSEAVDARTKELEEAQAAMVRSERLAALGQLTASVSHEIRNPLGTIAASAYSVRQKIETSDFDVARPLERIDRSVARCERVIRELLDFGRDALLQSEPTQLDAWLDEVLDDRAVVRDSRVTRSLHCDAIVEIDRERMRRCLINVIDNARDAGDENDSRSIDVSTRLVGDRIEISVRDYGPGVRSDDRERIFEPLFSTKNFGFGLGLPIVQQIMRRHGGSVAVEDAEGGGARVTLTVGLDGSAQSELSH